MGRGTARIGAIGPVPFDMVCPSVEGRNSYWVERSISPDCPLLAVGSSRTGLQRDYVEVMGLMGFYFLCCLVYVYMCVFI